MSYLPSSLGYGRAHTVAETLTDQVPPTQIAVPAENRDYFAVVLGGANHEFEFPTGLVAGERRILVIEVEHGGNDYDITAAGYDWGADGAPGTGPQGTRDFLTLIWNGATLSGSFSTGHA